ncbi:MAG: NADH-quinone oxidoreductase subunit C [Deltaproteobacteria bacterium]|nr:MAG: NADH-quinone oxidoreductase subunit C [Deltaproteobacteria bacterium]
MTPQEIHDRLKTRFGDKILDATLDDPATEPQIGVMPEALREVATLLAETPEFAFHSLLTLTAFDTLNKKKKTDELGVAYVLYAMEHRHRIMLKVLLPRENPQVPSVSQIWPTAKWHEREAWDLYGIRFTGLEDHRRILLPEDWEGHPMRKDYVVPESWHGIPTGSVLPKELPLGTKY